MADFFSHLLANISLTETMTDLNNIILNISYLNIGKQKIDYYLLHFIRKNIYI